MKPWIMVTAALAGVLLSLTLRAVLRREEPVTPPVWHADAATSNWDRHIAWATSLSQTVTIAAEPGYIARIGEEKPLLLLEDSGGGRTVVGSYQVEGEWLTLSDVRDLAPLQYVQLVAVYDDRQEQLMPVNVDLRTQR